MVEQPLAILPRPCRLTAAEGAFCLDVDTWIVLLPTAGDVEARAARALQAEIAAATGLELPIVKTATPVRTANVIVLAADAAAAQGFLPAQDEAALAAAGTELAAHGEQAHGVWISPQAVVAGGNGPLAVHYAAQTLRQVARLQGVIWPAAAIFDWPALPFRGVMLDVARGKVPTLATLEALVDEMSLYKLNVLQLYTEHTFRFSHHPRIGADSGSLTGDDILALDAYARERQVELIPNLQSFGHCAHLLALPEYAHLAESGAGWSLCPQDEGTYALLDDLYGDMLPAFSSPRFNVGCDETYDLGKGRSAAAVAERGTGRVYLEHLLRLHDLGAKHGRRVQIWGDILLHYPELVSELPEDVTLLDWHYEAEDDYPSVRIFQASGRDYWVCPGTSSWNTLFPRIENANANIRTLARLAVAHGASGLLNTDWGDHGHYQPLGGSWYGYLYGAEQAWTGGASEDADFDARFGALFFGAPGGAVVGAIRDLGRLNTLPGMARVNASNSVYLLFDEPLVGQVTADVPAETLRQVEAGCRAAEETLRSTLPTARDRITVEELILSAQLVAYAAHKGLACQEIRAHLAAPTAAGLTAAVATLRALDVELLALQAQWETQWLRRARRSEMGITLGDLAALRGRLAAAANWLSAQTPGEPADLADYAAGAEGYEVLGQGFWKRMRARGFAD